MSQALGLVETKGLVGAIVAADAMVKAANVTIIGKEKVAPALITIKIIGETAAVKSAIEAGAAAAQRVGQLISTHLIPHPDVQLGLFFPELLTETKAETAPMSISQTFERNEKLPEPAKQKKEPILRKVKKATKVSTQNKMREITTSEEMEAQSSIMNASLFDEEVEPGAKQSGSTLERLKAEALRDIQEEGISPDKAKKEEVPLEEKERYDFNNPSVSVEDLESFNVHQLRKLARGVEIFPIHGREISRANRETLLAYFKSIKK